MSYRNKVKINRVDAVELYNLFKTATGNTFSEQFGYCITENLVLMKPFYDEMVILEQSVVPTERYKQFMELKNQLAYRCSVIDAKNNITMQPDGNPVFKSFSMQEVFRLEFLKLVQEYQEEIIEYDTASNRLKELKEESVELFIFQIPLHFIPNMEYASRRLLTDYVCNESKSDMERKLFS